MVAFPPQDRAEPNPQPSDDGMRAKLNTLRGNFRHDETSVCLRIQFQQQRRLDVLRLIHSRDERSRAAGLLIDELRQLRQAVEALGPSAKPGASA